VPGGQDGPGAEVRQEARAGRDAYVAGRDQTVNVDNRRIEAAVPHPAEVSLPGPAAGLPRRPARVFEGRDGALGVLAGGLAARGGVVVTQAVYGLGGVGKSELALQYAHANRSDYLLTWWITADGPRQWRRAWPGWPGGCARWSRWRARRRTRPGGLWDGCRPTTGGC
jgi:hypothetical protein